MLCYGKHAFVSFHMLLFLVAFFWTAKEDDVVATATPRPSKLRLLCFGCVAVCLVLMYGSVLYPPARKEMFAAVLGIRSKCNQNPSKATGTKPRLMCMVITSPETYHSRGKAVKATWLPRCDRGEMFYSKDPWSYLPGAIELPVPEGRNHLTAKTYKALNWSHEHFHNDVNWYLKADDDTYVIVDNLKATLSKYDSRKAHFLGFRAMIYTPNGYNSGGAGYVLSAKAVEMLLKHIQTKGSCPQDGTLEDLDVAKCLAKLKIYPEQTLDPDGKITFHSTNPYPLLAGDPTLSSVYTYSKNNVTFGYKHGMKILSPWTVTFHYMDPGHVYFTDFLLYDLKRPKHKPDVFL